MKDRPLTDEETQNFGVMPEGATTFPDLQSYQKAVDKVDKMEKDISYETFCNQDEGIFWLKELRR